MDFEASLASLPESGLVLDVADRMALSKHPLGKIPLGFVESLAEEEVLLRPRTMLGSAVFIGRRRIPDATALDFSNLVWSGEESRTTLAWASLPQWSGGKNMPSVAPVDFDVWMARLKIARRGVDGFRSGVWPR